MFGKYVFSIDRMDEFGNFIEGKARLKLDTVRPFDPEAPHFDAISFLAVMATRTWGPLSVAELRRSMGIGNAQSPAGKRLSGVIGHRWSKSARTGWTRHGDRYQAPKVSQEWTERMRYTRRGAIVTAAACAAIRSTARAKKTADKRMREALASSLKKVLFSEIPSKPAKKVPLGW